LLNPAGTPGSDRAGEAAAANEGQAMRSLAELPADVLQVARDAADTLVRFREFLPPGGMLVMLVGRLRDDVREALEMEPLPRAYRGRERRSLDELTSVELDTVAGAVSILLQDRFTSRMDDPALAPLLREVLGALDKQKAERAQIRAEIGAS
jgi:hypothetical protein